MQPHTNCKRRRHFSDRADPSQDRRARSSPFATNRGMRPPDYERGLRTASTVAACSVGVESPWSPQTQIRLSGAVRGVSGRNLDPGQPCQTSACMWRTHASPNRPGA